MVNRVLQDTTRQTAPSTSHDVRRLAVFGFMMKQPHYIQEFIRACPSVRHVVRDKPSNAMGLWSLLYQEFWDSLGHAPRKTKQILAFCRISALSSSHPALREAVDYAFGEHLLDHQDSFPILARFLISQDLDTFAERLIDWNGKAKYSRRRRQLEKMIEAEQRTERD